MAEPRPPKFWLPRIAVGAAAALVALLSSGYSFADLWASPDRRAYVAFERGDYRRAAESFLDPAWIGTSWYRAGEFESAAQAFAKRDRADCAFGRGNAWLLRGRYDDAIAAYDRALELRPGWADAEINRDVAIHRKARMAPPADDAGGTGGKLEADDLVFDDRPQNSNGEAVDVGAGDKLSDRELRAMWLRKVQTRPADFLRVKFAYQLQRRDTGGERGK